MKGKGILLAGEDILVNRRLATIHGYLSSLEQERFITKIDSGPRSITITEEGLYTI